MPARVHILDDHVVNQIAAGEVVERPASVVKELVENAIDAGADEITVVIAGGGRSSIEVIDNGCGMSREDALLALQRFGTSKISSVNDLLGISTHGFRGEALPSIASVSRFVLSTAQSDGCGTEVEVEGGNLRNVAARSMSAGTRVQVRDIFINVPARRKFLRAEATETGMIKMLITDFAAAYPKLRLRLVADGKEVVLYAPAPSFTERIKQLRFGQGQPVIFEDELRINDNLLQLAGAVSQPVDCVADSSRLRLLVNNRSVRDKLLLRAVRDGYGNFLKSGRYPQGVLKLNLAVADVDVNVHPQKIEVRFRDPGRVFAAVRQCVLQALSAKAPEQSAALGPVPSYDYQLKLHSAPVVSFGAVPMQVSLSAPDYQTAFSPGAGLGEQGSASGSTTGGEPISQMRYIGQMFNLYLLLEGRERLAVVDMHAAHERVVFYRLKQQFAAGEINSQVLLLPETMVLAPDQVAHLAVLQPLLCRMGLECESFGEDCIVVRSVPAVLSGVSPLRLLADIFSLAEGRDWQQHLTKEIDAVLARMACHTAVRSGDSLTPQEVYALLEALEEAEAGAFCPHGRPVAVFVRRGELAQMFGRE